MGTLQPVLSPKLPGKFGRQVLIVRPGTVASPFCIPGSLVSFSYIQMNKIQRTIWNIFKFVQVFENSRDTLVKRRLTLAFPNAVTMNEPFLSPLFQAASSYISRRTDHDDLCDESYAAAYWIPGDRSLNDILRLSSFAIRGVADGIDLDRARLRRLLYLY